MRSMIQIAEVLAAHAGTVEIHQHGANRPLEARRRHGIVGGKAERRTDVREGVGAERDELHLAVAGGGNGANAIVTGDEPPVARSIERDEAVALVETAEIRELGHAATPTDRRDAADSTQAASVAATRRLSPSVTRGDRASRAASARSSSSPTKTGGPLTVRVSTRSR